MSLRRFAPLACLSLLAACVGPRHGTVGDGGTGSDGGPGVDLGPGHDAGPGVDAGPAMTCPAPPAGVSANAVAAITLENQVRVAMGVPCATMIETINLGAERHCQYYSANSGSCVSNPHVEVSGCAMYTAANFWDRMSAAGYGGTPHGEVMAFMGDGAGAVQQWIDSIWHRTPVLSPWVRDAGYGGTSSCDTMDFGDGASADPNLVATYPYADQTGVPVDFDGRYEGPPPPAPPGGWPSGYPVHVYIQGTITDHTLTDAGGAAVAHMWLGPSDPRSMGLLRTEYIMYANTALSAHSTYHVHVAGSNGAGPVTRDWAFTTL